MLCTNIALHNPNCNPTLLPPWVLIHQDWAHWSCVLSITPGFWPHSLNAFLVNVYWEGTEMPPGQDLGKSIMLKVRHGAPHLSCSVRLLGKSCYPMQAAFSRELWLCTVVRDGMKHQKEAVGRCTNYGSIHLSFNFQETSLYHIRCWQYRDERLSLPPHPNQGAHTLVRKWNTLAEMNKW